MPYPTLLMLLLPAWLTAQVSTFDQDNEDWTASGDPVSNTANWLPVGGNPGGYISVTDASTGGTWYFVAPAKFLGNKCDAYGKYLRYDQRTSDTTEQQVFGGQPDIRLVGNGLTLIFDHAYNPDLVWTHYDVLLREDGGWRINSLSGPVPTAAQFRSALSAISSLRIRGEYRSNADIGSLDNVVLESRFQLDLDADDSSGLPFSDFRASSTCAAQSPICDADVLLQSEAQLDSLVLQITPPGMADVLEISALPATLSWQHTGTGRYTLLNKGSATPADFAAALLLIRYHDLAPVPRRAERTVRVSAFSECGELGRADARLPLYPKPWAGTDRDTVICPGEAPLSLLSVLPDASETTGIWQPTLTLPGLFSPQKDTEGVYRYVLPSAGGCPGDTALIAIEVDEVPTLPPDTVLCRGEALTLTLPVGLAQWLWEPGGTVSSVVITEPGSVLLRGSTGQCVFADSVEVGFFNCQPCEFYAPNVFSPNDDGENDEWQIFSPCLWESWQLDVYDRWGSLVFSAQRPDEVWSGRAASRDLISGVYLWHLRVLSELRGTPRLYEVTGDVTLLR